MPFGTQSFVFSLVQLVEVLVALYMQRCGEVLV
jgi:hypothetical protein